MAPYRIIQWTTGHVGIHALDAIFDNPDLELVGVWAHSPSKVGVDAGELVGRPPCGVLATDDTDALLALDADVVCYTATGELRPFEALDDICRILASGANVVSTSLPVLHPKTTDPMFVEPLEAACTEGGSSCFFSGIDPGFANDVLAVVLSGVSQRIEEIRIREILNYSEVDQAETLFDLMGFGQTLDAEALILLPGVLTSAWGGTIQIIAEALGVELDGIEEWYERRGFEHDIPNIAGRTIEAGTQAGLRFEIRGVVDGRSVIVIEHVTRMHDDVAPDWPAQVGQGGYHVTISGAPNIDCTFHATGPDGEVNSGGRIVTAMKVLNAIPAVVDAPPGVLSANDMPIPTGKGLVQPR